MDEKQRNENGTKMRRKVLGDAYVDRTIKNVSSFNEEFQDMINRHAWGEIWTRPGLPLHNRSLITLAMLIALKQTDELRLHLRGALNNGVTREEIKEVMMQSAIYCGVPAANSAFHIARDVFAEIDAGK
jgi:4-carboxymuconolactone decarboxylase